MNVFALGNDVRRLDTVRRILVIGNGEVGFQIFLSFLQTGQVRGVAFLGS